MTLSESLKLVKYACIKFRGEEDVLLRCTSVERNGTIHESSATNSDEKIKPFQSVFLFLFFSF